MFFFHFGCLHTNKIIMWEHDVRPPRSIFGALVNQPTHISTCLTRINTILNTLSNNQPTHLFECINTTGYITVVRRDGTLITPSTNHGQHHTSDTYPVHSGELRCGRRSRLYTSHTLRGTAWQSMRRRQNGCWVWDFTISGGHRGSTAGVYHCSDNTTTK